MQFRPGKGEITLLDFCTAFLLAKIVALIVYFILNKGILTDANLSTFISRGTELVCISMLLTANFLPHKFPFREIFQHPNLRNSNMGPRVIFIVIIVVISRYALELLLVLPSTFLDLGINKDSKQLGSPEGMASISLLASFMSKNVLAQITAVPLVEEIIYRGILLNLLLSRSNVTNSILISSIAFAVLHGHPVTAFFGGLIFAHIYVKTRNLWLCILGHSCANITVIFLNHYADYIYPNLSSSISIRGPNFWLCGTLTVVWLVALLIATFKYRRVYLISPFGQATSFTTTISTDGHEQSKT